mgnify:CR=1 FL=1|tara:strand:+ start:124 stop:393 length:270 start_codon:yes stop_codon:yes gene_type:complete
MSDYNINLNAIAFESLCELLKLDESFVGTKKYMGIAYFWGHEYKHHLRDASVAKRRKIHNTGLKQNIDFQAPNKKAWDLIFKVLGKESQ